MKEVSFFGFGEAEPADPNALVKQSFQLVGVREYENNPLEVMQILVETARDWLKTQPAVIKWRIQPEISRESDYETKRNRVKFYARGSFDIDVKLADHKSIYKEL